MKIFQTTKRQYWELIDKALHTNAPEFQGVFVESIIKIITIFIAALSLVLNTILFFFIPFGYNSSVAFPYTASLFLTALVTYFINAHGHWKIARYIMPLVFYIIATANAYVYGVSNIDVSFIGLTLGFLLTIILFRSLLKWLHIYIVIFLVSIIDFISPVQSNLKFSEFLYWFFINISYFFGISLLLMAITDQINAAIKQSHSYSIKLVNDIAYRKVSEEKLTYLSRNLVRLSSKAIKNLQFLIELGAQLLNASCAVYKRNVSLEDTNSIMSWNIPKNFQPSVFFDDKIFEGIISNYEGPIIENGKLAPDSQFATKIAKKYVSFTKINIKSDKKSFGTLFLFFKTRYQLTDVDKNLIGIIAAAIRENENKLAVEDTLKLSEELYHQIFDSANDAIFIYDFNSGKIIDCNNRAEELYGYSKEVLLTRRITESASNEKGFTEKDAKKMLKKAIIEGPILFEWKIINPKGETIWLEINLKKVVLNDKVRFVSIERDITNRKNVQDELIKAKKDAERTKKAKEELFVNMSHELRTPMNAVVGLINLLTTTKINEGQEKYIRALKLSADNLLAIINDILNFSKINSGDIVFKQVPFNIKNVIKNAIESIEHQATSKNLFLEYSFEEKIPTIVVGDPGRLSQIILNLINNAIKFTLKGSIKLDVKLLDLNNDWATIQFNVTDTGIGIAKSKLNLIFESYVQANNKINRKFGGTGLGLAIVKQLVEKQNGTVSVVSQLKNGATFSVIIPYKLMHQSSSIPKNGHKVTIKTTKKLKGINVLLVEDNKFNQLVAENILKKWKINVEIAENGKIALDKLKAKTYDLILMDLQMPEVDGYTASKHIRIKLSSRKSKIPIIAMSAHAMNEEKVKAAKAGINDYIVKPFTPEELISKVEKYI